MKEVTNKWWFWVLVAFLVMFIVSVMFNPDPPVSEVEEIKSPVSEEETDYNVEEIKSPDLEDSKREEFKDAFMGGCVIDESMRAFCECSFSYYETELGIDGFEREAERFANTNEYSDVMTKAAEACQMYLY